MVEVGHKQTSERDGGNDGRASLLSPSTSRTEVVRRVERGRQGIAVVALFDGVGRGRQPHR